MTKADFIQEKGFNLLAVQLKQFNVSVQLISALVSLALGQEVNLSKEQSVSLLFLCVFCRPFLHVVQEFAINVEQPFAYWLFA